MNSMNLPQNSKNFESSKLLISHMKMSGVEAGGLRLPRYQLNEVQSNSAYEILSLYKDYAESANENLKVMSEKALENANSAHEFIKDFVRYGIRVDCTPTMSLRWPLTDEAREIMDDYNSFLRMNNTVLKLQAEIILYQFLLEHKESLV